MPRELGEFFAATFESIWRVSARRDHPCQCVCPTVVKIAGISAGSEHVHGRPIGYQLHGGRLVAITTKGLRLFNPHPDFGDNIDRLIDQKQWEAWPEREAMNDRHTGTLAALFPDEKRARDFFSRSISERGKEACVQTKLVLRHILAGNGVFKIHPGVLQLLDSSAAAEDDLEARAFVLRR